MEQLEKDLRSPVAPGTQCRAEYDFAASESGELAFSAGDLLTLLCPSERLFWYHAKHMESGRSGLAPISHVTLPVEGLKRMKPGCNGFEFDDDAMNDCDFVAKPASCRTTGILDLQYSHLEPCYKSYESFKRLSGWFTARCSKSEPCEAMLPRALAEKCGMSLDLFISSDCPAIYMFDNRRTLGKKYIGYAHRFFTELQHLFIQLYGKKVHQLNGLQRELLFHAPVASDWIISVELLSEHEEPNLEWMAQRQIIERECLRGEKKLGLNDTLKFTSRTDWDKFISWFDKKWHCKSQKGMQIKSTQITRK